MTVSTPISKETEIDLTVRQELKMLEAVKRNLVDTVFLLGYPTRFTDLKAKIEALILDADREIIAADDYITERS
jgi:hypothetical protein